MFASFIATSKGLAWAARARRLIADKLDEILPGHGDRLTP